MNLNHYAATPSDPAAGLLGCGAHTDYGALTFLLTDEVPGLQVRSRVPTDPNLACSPVVFN
jgi:isopenicillin N synthase-like dioxygenase